MSEPAWLAATLGASRPRVLSALLRHGSGLDAAEDAFQEASLRALERWPRTGPPRDPVAWLVLVARNASIDRARRTAREAPLPAHELAASDGDAEHEAMARIEAEDFRDDVLRLLFLCCHPELEPPQQLALALRVVSGLGVREIARAFLVSEAAMEQRITRAKRVVAERRVPFEAPGRAERAERLGVVAAALYALFNEGYSASGGESHVRAPLCDEAIRLARLLISLAPGEGELFALLALFLLQHARTPARLDARGSTRAARSCCSTRRIVRAGTGARSPRVSRCSTRRAGSARPARIGCKRRSPPPTRARRAPRTRTGPRSRVGMRSSSGCSPRR